MSAFTGYGDARHVKRLRVNLAVNGLRKKFAEGGCVYVGGVEDRFIGVQTGSRIVIVLGDDILRQGSGGAEQKRCTREKGAARETGTVMALYKPTDTATDTDTHPLETEH